MTTPRDLRLRRARLARRSVVALGAAGAIGTAVALGATAVTTNAATTSDRNGATGSVPGTSSTAPHRPAAQQQKAPALGGQGSGSPSHATSSGS